MSGFVALLRGINVGRNNKIGMAALKTAFAESGFTDPRTYINSGNVLFSSEKDIADIQRECRALIGRHFGLDIAVAVLGSAELAESVAGAPDWWGREAAAKHNAIFVIAPATVQEVLREMGPINEDYERLAFHGNVIFWSAPIATFSRTRYGAMAKHAAYRKVTVRNFNTTCALAGLANPVQLLPTG